MMQGALLRAVGTAEKRDVSGWCVTRSESSELRETLSNGVGTTLGAPASFGRAAISS
jgi:hypothetical protein